MKQKKILSIILAALMLSGCGRKQAEANPSTQAVLPAETTSLPAPETEPETSELTKTWDPEKICLHLRPTGIVTEGEDCRYYIPQDQCIWLEAFESAASSKIPEQYWQPEDRSTGVWLRYQDEWWRFLENGDILTLSHERISGEHCQELTDLVENALDSLGLTQPVRPEQIHDLRQATLAWNGSHTLTDPVKLTQLEQMLSGSQELPSGASCGFAAFLTLERKDGTDLTLSTATDDCGTWLSQGVFYEYSQDGNVDFYALFEVQNAPEPIQPDTPATPVPWEPDASTLVRISDYIPGVIQDLRYATENNFTGKTIYSFNDAYLRYGTVKKLQAASQVLAEQGYSLVIWDAFRPVSAQQTLWGICPDPAYVSHPVTGNRNHCRGNAIDITLADAQGNLLEMPSEFDDFTSKADRDYSDCTPEAAANALLLQDIMEEQGFIGYGKEWWHFADSTDYPVEGHFEPLTPYRWFADCNEYITLRREPSTSAEAICRIPAGGEMTMLAHCTEFAYVTYQDKTGYVLRSYLASLDEVDSKWSSGVSER